MRSHGYPFRRPSGLPAFGRRVDRISAEGWGDGSHPPRWQRTPHDLDRPPLCSVAGWPQWSPDGSMLVLQLGYGGQADLYTVRPDGSGFVQVTDTPDLDETDPTRVRGRASKEPRRVGAGYRRPTGRTPRHGRARLSRHRTRIQGEVGMMRLGSARDWGRAPPPLDDVMIAGRRRDPSVSVTLRLAHAPPTHVLLLISHRE